MAEPRRIKPGKALGSIFRRMVLPRHLRQLLSRLRRKGKAEAVYDFGKQVQYVTGKELAAFENPQLQLYSRILKPGGRWVMCDYFRREPEVKGSGHVWGDFLAAAADRGWHLVHQEDVTDHILPTVRFARMLAQRFGLSLLGYGAANLKRKRPALHYLVEEVLDDVEGLLKTKVEQLDPERFANDKRYMLLALVRESD
jgi:hypothetical protein